ncbi:uncharacterized protein LOC134684702 [Mytilus trossulus]|uniref:uncharacterized protein LOC134684702 n=1 Tax=Mytilus trossulus TaxID=6551 RepID=UPI0030042A52
METGTINIHDISNEVFINDVLGVLKFFLLDVVDRSRVTRAELYKRVNSHNLRCREMPYRTRTILDEAVMKPRHEADITELSTLIKNLIVASDFGKQFEFELTLHNVVRAAKGLRNQLRHPKHPGQPLSKQQCVSILVQLMNLAYRLKQLFDEVETEYFQHVIYKIIDKFFNPERRKKVIEDVLREESDVKEIKVIEEKECVKFILCEVGTEKDDSKIGPMNHDLEENANEDVKKHCHAERIKLGMTKTSIDEEEKSLEDNTYEAVKKDCDTERNILGNSDWNIRDNGEWNIQGHGERNIQDHGERNIRGHGERNIQGHGEKNIQGNGEWNRQGDGERNIQGHGERNNQGHGKRNIKSISSVNDKGERYERYSNDCELYALSPIDNKSKPRTNDKKMTRSNTVWHITRKSENVKYLMEDPVVKPDICYMEEDPPQGEMQKMIQLEKKLQQRVCGLSMISSREVSRPGRPVLPILTQTDPLLFLLGNEDISCRLAYQLQVGLMYHNKITFLLLSQLEKAKQPSFHINKSESCKNYKYDLLICYFLDDREKAIRIKSLIKVAINDVSVKLYEEVATPGGFKFELPPKSRKFLILITKGMIEDKSLIHEIENFIVGTANENLLPQDYFVSVVDNHAEVPKSFIAIKQFPLANIADFIDWYKRS